MYTTMTHYLPLADARAIDHQTTEFAAWLYLMCFQNLTQIIYINTKNNIDRIAGFSF